MRYLRSLGVVLLAFAAVCILSRAGHAPPGATSTTTRGETLTPRVAHFELRADDPERASKFATLKLQAEEEKRWREKSCQ
jgi:hypothetical protein